MGSTGALSASSSITQGASSLGSAYAQSQALKSQGEYQAQIAEQNASLARLQAKSAMDVGNAAASRVAIQTRQVIGSQRGGYAAGNVEVNSGSAAGVQASTAGIGALDQLTIKNNAWRQAWGYQQQALNDTIQGKMTSIAANAQAGQTLLTGGMNFLSAGMKGGYQYASALKAPDRSNDEGEE